MKCGNCKDRHDSVKEVRECYGAAQPAEPPATGKQKKLLAALARGIHDGMTEADVQAVVDEADTKAKASFTIDNLSKTAGIKPVWSPREAETTVELEDGLYILGDDTFKVVHAIHGSGKQYAKKLVRKGDNWSWAYEGRGPLADLRPEHRMTQEDAAEFGKVYGICVRCAADLTREESIYVGYGPTCAKNEGWYYPTKTELAELIAE